MTRFISISSGKGGVGKTICAINLAHILNSIGTRTILVDGNFTTPNVSLYLGSPILPVTIHDIIEKNMDVKKAIYKHPSGIRVVPSNISLSSVKSINALKFNNALLNLTGKAEIVLVDTPPGINEHLIPILESCDENLIITQSELAAITEAMKIAKLSIKYNTEILGYVINRKGLHQDEIEISEIKDLIDNEIIGQIREDKNMSYSLIKKYPLSYLKPNSTSSNDFKKLAYAIIGEKNKVIHYENAKQVKDSFLKLMGLK